MANTKLDNTEIQQRLGQEKYTALLERLKTELPQAYAEKRVDSYIKNISIEYDISSTTLYTKVVKPLKQQFSLKPLSKEKIVKKSRYTDQEYQTVIDCYEKQNMGVADILKAQPLGDRTPPKATVLDILRRKSKVYQEKNKDKSRISAVQKENIFELFQKETSIQEIATATGISRKTVETILFQKDVDLTPGKTEQEKLEIYHFYVNFDGKDATGETSKKFAVSETRVRDLVREVIDKYDVPERDNSDSYRKYTLDQTFFDVIDTQEKAYILGLIATDGNVSKNVVSLELKRTDNEILKKVSKCLNSNKPLMNTIHFDKKCNHHTEGVKVSFISSRLCDALKNYGIVPNKSLTLTVAMDKIPTELHNAFWRGAIDGDGAIFTNNGYLTLEFYGSINMCSAFQLYLLSMEVDVNINAHHSIWCVRTSGKNARLIGNVLYSDNKTIYIERKFSELNKNSQQ